MLKYTTYRSIHNQSEEDEQQIDTSGSDIHHTSTGYSEKQAQQEAIHATQADKDVVVDEWTYVPTVQKIRKPIQPKGKKTLRQKTLHLIQSTAQKVKWKSGGRLMVCFVFAGVLLYGGVIHNFVVADKVEGPTQKVVVHAGDSLWSIAKEYKSVQTDTRDYIAQIRSENQLDSSEIQAGDVLVIPYD
ncbi:hypothetical protein PTI45_00527 [Paenibacillus nuruki]|uniref:LysM domain-containing protein n=1 Tax=Paenibacillus nuruki TaxID=1886670 RepID=A0A1E3L8W0_9BACL|nr:LysM peptidoglycan-binding domain-containing protein [Paenibacillus nuruki]ODP30074.1 hypothetical protein PTI45_00527 [Paenibacillus nuruki]